MSDSILGEQDHLGELLGILGYGPQTNSNAGVIDPLATDAGPIGSAMGSNTIAQAAGPSTNNSLGNISAALGNLGALASLLKGGADNTAKAWGDMSTLGKVQTGIGIGTNLLGAYNGLQQSRLAEKTYKFNRDMMQREHQNAVNSYNARAADRQAIRHARDPSKYASVSDYMAQYGAK